MRRVIVFTSLRGGVMEIEECLAKHKAVISCRCGGDAGTACIDHNTCASPCEAASWASNRLSAKHNAAISSGCGTALLVMHTCVAGATHPATTLVLRNCHTCELRIVTFAHSSPLSQTCRTFVGQSRGTAKAAAGSSAGIAAGAGATAGAAAVGGASASGMNQQQQREVLQAFREGLFNTLVATCIGEEGLDIPEVRSKGAAQWRAGAQAVVP